MSGVASLFVGGARDFDAGMPIGILHQTAAIEAARIVAAVVVRCAHLLARGFNHDPAGVGGAHRQLRSHRSPAAPY